MKWAKRIATQFRLTGDDYYRYEFQITDGVFNESDSEEQEAGRDAINSTNAAVSFYLLERERVGRLRLGLSENQVSAIVPGEPQKGEDVFWAAIGEYGQEWYCPAQGITLQMMSSTPGGEKVIGSIGIMAPSTLKSQRGIGIGSAEADVFRAYEKFRAPDSDDFGKPGGIFVADSLFGGMIFTFSDGKVSEIFLGAASE